MTYPWITFHLFFDFLPPQQVMKFAEMTQEVQIPRPTPMRSNTQAEIGLTPGRRKANQIYKIAVHNLEEGGYYDANKLDVDLGLVYSLGPNFPEYRMDSPETDSLIKELMLYLEQRIQKRRQLLDDLNARRKNDSFFNFIRTT
jgi:kinesin family member 23